MLAEPPLNATEPKACPPSLKVTTPVGLPLDEVTAAVKVTGWPNWLGLLDDDKLVVVAIPAVLLLTTSATGVAELAANVASPP